MSCSRTQHGDPSWVRTPARPLDPESEALITRTPHPVIMEGKKHNKTKSLSLTSNWPGMTILIIARCFLICVITIMLAFRSSADEWSRIAFGFCELGIMCWLLKGLASPRRVRFVNFVSIWCACVFEVAH